MWRSMAAGCTSCSTGFHGLCQGNVANYVADYRGDDANQAREGSVVQHKLALAPAGGKKRADDGAFLFDGAGGKHYEHERHDNDEHQHQRFPHGLVALNVVGGVADTLVCRLVGKVGKDSVMAC